MPEPRITVIIPSYNAIATIKRTLDSVLSLRSFDRINEVIVVDSSDDQKTRELLKTYNYSMLKLLLLDKKTPPAAGRNLGAKQATGELLCFIDSDVYLADDWLEKVLVAFRNGCKAGCGSVSIPPFQSRNELALAQLYLQFNESLNVGTARPVTMVPACNMFVARSLFTEVGGFPDMRASEDVVLCLRLGEKTKVWFLPQARCFHVFRQDKQAYFRNQVMLGKYIIIYRRMMYSKWYYRGIWPLVLLPAFLIIKSTNIKLRIMRAGWKHFFRYVFSIGPFTMGLFYWTVGFVQGCLERES